MSSVLAKYGNFDNFSTYQHFCDTYDDLAKIDPTEINLGSIAIVIEGVGGGLEVYIAKSTKEWVLLTVSSGSSGGGGSSSDSEEAPLTGRAVTDEAILQE